MAVAVFFLGTQGTAQTSRHVVVHAGHVLDVKTGKLLADQMLVIEDGKIVSAGAAAEAKIPADAVRIELPNATVLPGLIDAHTHLTMDPKFGYDRLAISVAARGPDRRQERAAHAAGWIHYRAQRGRTDFTDVALRDAINAGDVPGPRTAGERAGAEHHRRTLRQQHAAVSNITPPATASPMASRPCSTRFARTSSTAPI